MKKILTPLLALVLVVAIAAMSVGAGSPPADKESTASIELTPGQPEIIDPTDPSLGLKDSDIKFGTHQITGNDETYNSIEAVGAAIKDARGLAKSEWTLKFKISKFFIADGAGAPTTEESLQNFKISMLPGTHDIKNSTGVVTSDPHMPEKATITELGAESEKTLFLSNAA